MATKKKATKSAPKTIKYRGLTLTRNDYGEYVNGPFRVRNYLPLDRWEASVNVGSCNGVLKLKTSFVFSDKKSPQKALDLALDDALEALSDHILELTKDKKALLNIKKGK